VEIAVGDQTDRLRREPSVRLPKGTVEEGESHAEAALREVREETGFDARIVTPLGPVDYVYEESGARVEKVVYFFLMEWLPGAPATRDGELDDVTWRPLDEAARALTFDTEREVLARARVQLEDALP
jgi:8-oxo-dGTP pyrophosphatase MutT (NUDIX family)